MAEIGIGILLLLVGVGLFRHFSEVIFLWRLKKLPATSDPDVMIFKGDLLLRYGCVAAAIRCFEQLVARYPNSPTGYYRLGLAYTQDRFYRGSQIEKTLTRALALNNDFLEARLVLALFYHGVGLFSKADLMLGNLPGDLLEKRYRRGEADLAELTADPIEFRRESPVERIILGLVYILQTLFIGLGIATREWVVVLPFVALCLPVQLALHTSLSTRLKLDADGLIFSNCWRRIRCRWSDVQDLWEGLNHRVVLILACGSITIDILWQHYEEIVRRIKHQLYLRQWQPSLKKLPLIYRFMASE